jgi:hypothetical protein
MYYVKLSGFIPKNKQREFEQTYRLVSSQIPKTCPEHNISKDIAHENVYHFVSYCVSPDAMEAFSHSPAFIMLIGAFKTLGKLSDHTQGEMVPTKN